MDTVVVYKTKADTLYRSIAPVATPVHKMGDNVQVSWGGDWYPAKIIGIKDDQYKISYDGYDAGWDEWVGVARIKKRQSSDRKQLPDHRQYFFYQHNLSKMIMYMFNNSMQVSVVVPVFLIRKSFPEFALG